MFHAVYAAATLQIQGSFQCLTAVRRCFADQTLKEASLKHIGNADLQGSIAEFLGFSTDFEAGSGSFAKVCACFQLGVPHLAPPKLGKHAQILAKLRLPA